MATAQQHLGKTPIKSEPNAASAAVSLGYEDDSEGRGIFIATITNVGTEVLYDWTVELLAPRSVVVGVSNQSHGAYREKHSDEKTSLFNNSLAHAKENPIRPGGKYTFKISYQVTEYSVRLLDEKVVGRAYVREKVEDQKERPLSELTSFFAASAVALRAASKLRSEQILGSRG